jgi:TolB protein
MKPAVRSILLLGRLALLALLAAASLPARANLTIEIIGGGATQIPIAVVSFAREPILPQSVTEVVGADLARSGLFRLVPPGNNRPSEPSEVLYPEWQSRGVEALVIGSVAPLQDGRFEIRFRLLDVLKQQQIAGYTYTVSPAQLRLTAHRIADEIYERLTGDKGVFSTRIAYVVRQGKRYELQVADADGFNPQTVVTSNEPIISPAWSPDGTRLAYVSFENRKPIVYVQNLLTGQRRVLANYPGSNSAPAWSPDGKRLAVVLTKDGISQIYLINPDGTGLKRLTHSGAIDTEPSFSPDGEWILFTSDRGGSPQIYRIAVNGGSTVRFTFEGDYNVSPHYSPDGKSFVFITRRQGRFNVAVQDMVTGQVQVLTDSRLDESPTFAPNGRMILYATEVGGRGVLAAVSSDGRVRQRLTVPAGDVREPAWGPFVQ